MRVFHEGDRLVSVTVSEAFTEAVVLDANCRDQDVTVAHGETVRIEREEDGEECAIRLVADDEAFYEVDIRDYEAYDLTVTGNGEVESVIAER